MAPTGFVSVKISGVEWAALRRLARQEYGMGVGEFLGLLGSNFIRKRWPLELWEPKEKP